MNYIRMPRVNIPNAKAAQLYKSYQHVGSRELVEILGISRSTATNRVKYAMQYGVENRIYAIDPARHKYLFYMQKRGESMESYEKLYEKERDSLCELIEQNTFPTAKKEYRAKTIQSGQYLEVQLYEVWDTKSRNKGKTRKPSRHRQEELNQNTAK